MAVTPNVPPVSIVHVNEVSAKVAPSSTNKYALTNLAYVSVSSLLAHEPAATTYIPLSAAVD